MKVFIAGATGDLGKHLIPQFRARGHTVMGLARSPEAEQLIQTMGGESRRANLFDVDSLARAADGAEVVIHAATAIPTKPKPAARDWLMNDRIRREGTTVLTAAAAKIGARIYLQQSIAAVAQPPGDSFFDEDSPTYPNPITQSALDGEQIALEAGERYGFAVGVLRFGWFYSPESAFIRMMAKGLVKRQMPLIGSGQAILASLHTEDAALALVAAAEAGRQGLWHVVDDHGATFEALFTGLTQRLGAPAPFHIPAWLGRFLMGRNGVEIFTRSMRTTNQRFRREVGWTPRYPCFEEGLDQVIAAWQAEGFLTNKKNGRI